MEVPLGNRLRQRRSAMLLGLCVKRTTRHLTRRGLHYTSSDHDTTGVRTFMGVSFVRSESSYQWEVPHKLITGNPYYETDAQV